MKAYISDIIPKIQRFSQKLDNNTLLMNQHWVIVDDLAISKNVYIFRSNNELLISENGKVEKAKWENLGNNSLIIDKKEESYLFKQGFFDENILALKIDSTFEEYVFFINENKFHGELNSYENVIEFLHQKYLQLNKTIEIKGIKINFPVPEEIEKEVKLVLVNYKTNKGEISILQKLSSDPPKIGDEVFKDDNPAKDGKYKLGFMWYLYLENGKVIDNKMT